VKATGCDLAQVRSGAQFRHVLADNAQIASGSAEIESASQRDDEENGANRERDKDAFHARGYPA